MGRWARKPVNHTSWVAVVTPTDRPKSVRNRCLIELFCGVVCVVTLPFWHFCWCRGFCHRTESDLFLFLFKLPFLFDKNIPLSHTARHPDRTMHFQCTWAEGSSALLLSRIVRRPSLTFHIFDFFSETAVRNSTKVNRKQDLNVLYQVCVFDPMEKTRWPPRTLWLRHFWLLLWNRLMEFNETWQEAGSQRPLPSLCFSGRSEKRDGRPGLWLAETFSTPPLKLLNGIQQNLTGSKITTSSTESGFLRLIEKTKMAALATDWWRYIHCDTWLYSSPTN